MYRADFEMFKAYICSNKQADYYVLYIVGRYSGKMCYSSEVLGHVSNSDILLFAHKTIEEFKYKLENRQHDIL